MLCSCTIVASLLLLTNLISPHVVLWPACFCRADSPEFAASYCRYPWFQFQRWFCICLEIMSSPFFHKSFSYAGFEVRKNLLFCIQNTTILSIQKLPTHDNQISKTKIWTIVILHSSWPNFGIRYVSISDSSKVENLGLFNVSFWITVANILTAKYHATSGSNHYNPTRNCNCVTQCHKNASFFYIRCTYM